MEQVLQYAAIVNASDALSVSDAVILFQERAKFHDGSASGLLAFLCQGYDSPPKREDLATVRRTNSAMKAAMARWDLG